MGKEMAPHSRAEDNSLGVLNSELPEGPPTLLYGGDYMVRTPRRNPSSPSWGSGLSHPLTSRLCCSKSQSGLAERAMGERAAGGPERGRPPRSPPHRLPQGRPRVGTSCLRGAWERPATVPGDAQPTAWGEGVLSDSLPRGSCL